MSKRFKNKRKKKASYIKIPILLSKFDRLVFLKMDMEELKYILKTD